MATETIVVEKRVKMKFVGVTKENSREVDLPIPLIANSQKLADPLVFSRPAGTKGPLLCDVPMKWAGALLAVGGNWQINEKLTDELAAQIEKAREATEKEMATFALENQMVET